MNKNLPIFGVPGLLDDYTTTKSDIQNGQNRFPPTRFLLPDEDVFDPVQPNQPSLTRLLSSLSIDDEDELPKANTPELKC